MKGLRAISTIAPVAAVMSALATLACCLPWGIGAALGALGLSVFLARFQLELIVLAVVLLSWARPDAATKTNLPAQQSSRDCTVVDRCGGGTRGCSVPGMGRRASCRPSSLAM